MPATKQPVHPVWLFPVTYAVHLLEEYFVGGGFPDWAQRAFGIQLSNREFVAWNAFAFALICAGAMLVSRHQRFRFIEIALAIAVLGNAAAHIVGSLATWTYSPGLITGVFIWTPLGWIRFQTVAQSSSRRTRIVGTCVGVFVTIVILAVLASATLAAAPRSGTLATTSDSGHYIACSDNAPLTREGSRPKILTRMGRVFGAQDSVSDLELALE